MHATSFAKIKALPPFTAGYLFKMMHAGRFTKLKGPAPPLHPPSPPPSYATRLNKLNIPVQTSISWHTRPHITYTSRHLLNLQSVTTPPILCHRRPPIENEKCHTLHEIKPPAPPPVLYHCRSPAKNDASPRFMKVKSSATSP